MPLVRSAGMDTDSGFCCIVTGINWLTPLISSKTLQSSLIMCRLVAYYLQSPRDPYGCVGPDTIKLTCTKLWATYSTLILHGVCGHCPPPPNFSAVQALLCTFQEKCIIVKLTWKLLLRILGELHDGYAFIHSCQIQMLEENKSFFSCRLFKSKILPLFYCALNRCQVTLPDMWPSV